MTLNIELDTEENPEEFMYSPGDYIHLYPQNKKELVAKILTRMSADSPPCDKIVQIETRREKTCSGKNCIENS